MSSMPFSPNNNALTRGAAINLRLGSGGACVCVCVQPLLIQKDYMHYKIELFSLDSVLETELDFSSCPKNALSRLNTIYYGCIKLIYPIRILVFFTENTLFKLQGGATTETAFKGDLAIQSVCELFLVRRGAEWHPLPAQVSLIARFSPRTARKPKNAVAPSLEELLHFPAGAALSPRCPPPPRRSALPGDGAPPARQRADGPKGAEARQETAASSLPDRPLGHLGLPPPHANAPGKGRREGAGEPGRAALRPGRAPFRRWALLGRRGRAGPARGGTGGGEGGPEAQGSPRPRRLGRGWGERRGPGPLLSL